MHRLSFYHRLFSTILFHEQWCTGCFQMSFVVGTATIFKRDWKFTPLFSLYHIFTPQFKMDVLLQLDQGWWTTDTVWDSSGVSLQVLTMLIFRTTLELHWFMKSKFFAEDTFFCTLYIHPKYWKVCFPREK